MSFLNPKTDICRKINLLPDEKSHGLGMQREPCSKKPPVSHDFGLRSSFIQKPFQTKRATFIVARVLSRVRSDQGNPTRTVRFENLLTRLDPTQVHPRYFM